MDKWIKLQGMEDWGAGWGPRGLERRPLALHPGHCGLSPFPGAIPAVQLAIEMLGIGGRAAWLPQVQCCGT